ncbi:uncharacterized protein [Mobula birostris]|uniref:uncharacterized protein n=1 Tax=Mobula birostris TaxID=1983395 RepID=UPI003B289048
MLAQSVKIAVLLGIIYCLLSRATCDQDNGTNNMTVATSPTPTDNGTNNMTVATLPTPTVNGTNNMTVATLPTPTVNGTNNMTVATSPTSTVNGTNNMTVATSPTPTVATSPTPTVATSPTPTVATSPTPTVATSPTPTVATSPTPTVATSPTPTVATSPTPTVATSPTPTVATSPTPTVATSPTPTVATSPTPTVATSPTPTVATSPTPTVATSPTPTVATSPTPTGNNAVLAKFWIPGPLHKYFPKLGNVAVFILNFITVSFSVATSPTPTDNGTNNMTVATSPTPTVNGTNNMTVATSPTPTDNGTNNMTVATSPTPTENTTAVMTAVTTSPTAQSCSSTDCGENAICRPLHSGPKCECAYNLYRENGICVTGKTFGGELTLKEEFQEEMKDVSSKIYQDLLNRVTEVFKESLKGFGYKSTIIYDVRKGSVIMDVTNTFEQNSKVNESDIEKAIQQNFTYSTVQGCKLDNCDQKTTVGCAQPQYGLTECICKEEFYKTSRNDTKCIETCELKCKGKSQHCVPQNGNLVCECQPGYKDNNGSCERCPFGYNGINCEDGYQAAIVATGVVCGVVILILAIVLITLCVRLNRSEPDEQEQPILGSMSRESPGISEFPSKIPRVNLGGPTNRGSLNYLQSESNQYDYSRPSPWNELSELHQRDSYPNRKYNYHN